jgi:N-dimethylarginine dimethylaminohydrolase
VSRHYVLCAPDHFAVLYAINPWMDPSRPVDRTRARAQWDELRATYERLGHRVDVLPAAPGLPDMVFAANGALVVDGVAVGARFATAERAAEADHHLAWLRANGFPAAAPALHVNEGEGDFLFAGDVVLAGSGFRSEPAAHAEVAVRTGREVVPLRLVDPRYYHLDTALVVLDDRGGPARAAAAAAGERLRPAVAYFPPAFAAASLAELERRWPDAIIVQEPDAAVLGCNAVSDGHNVVLPVEAVGLAERLAHEGYVPVPVALDELLAAGGGPKCCTLELRHPPAMALDRVG